jgi:hypothetical protein
MEEKNNQNQDSRRERRHWHWHKRGRGKGFGGVYFLVFLGALIYYLQHATSFGMGVLGVLKALAWPAVLIYKVYGMLGM